MNQRTLTWTSLFKTRLGTYLHGEQSYHHAKFQIFLVSQNHKPLHFVTRICNLYNVHMESCNECKKVQLILIIFAGLGNIFNLLLSINAACNFLLYCVLSAKYRKTFKALFCERSRLSRLRRQETLALSLTRSTNSQRFNPNSSTFKKNANYCQTPRNLEVTIYVFNKEKYVNTYNLRMRRDFFSNSWCYRFGNSSPSSCVDVRIIWTEWFVKKELIEKHTLVYSIKTFKCAMCGQLLNELNNENVSFADSKFSWFTAI